MFNNNIFFLSINYILYTHKIIITNNNNFIIIQIIADRSSIFLLLLIIFYLSTEGLERYNNISLHNHNVVVRLSSV